MMTVLGKEMMTKALSRKPGRMSPMDVSYSYWFFYGGKGKADMDVLEGGGGEGLG